MCKKVLQILARSALVYSRRSDGVMHTHGVCKLKSCTCKG
jgi:hypothetical protein